jgi:hypothetical protein
VLAVNQDGAAAVGTLVEKFSAHRPGPPGAFKNSNNPYRLQ